MASEHNRIRRKWQHYGGNAAGVAEAAFFGCFKQVFVGTDYLIRAKPSEFRNIYVDIALKPEELAAIYNPVEAITRHGVTPDYAIENKKSGRIIYVEVKRQDGWVDGGKRSDGRGNAHERSSKYFTPGLQRILREKSKIPPPALPFWTVFLGDITRDPCRVREVTCWYEGFAGHFFFWRQAPDPDLLFAHFDEHIGPLLDGDGSLF
jgi:hypothetical protein